MKRFSALLGSGLLALVGVAAADVKVSFIDADKFVDIKDNTGFRDMEVLKQLEAHLIEQAQKHLPGCDVKIDVTDVDLAGNVEPFGHQARWVRVLRQVTLPSIWLSYEVREDGKVVRQGQATLRDMNYRDGFNTYFSSDALRYEKRMIDRWFKEEFSAKIATARPAVRRQPVLQQEKNI